MKTTLTPCAACGKEIAKNARACPHCGKRFMSLGAVVVICLLVLGVAFIAAVKVMG